LASLALQNIAIHAALGGFGRFRWRRRWLGRWGRRLPVLIDFDQFGAQAYIVEFAKVVGCLFSLKVAPQHYALAAEKKIYPFRVIN
jgi:hypothetical protein